VNEITPTGTAWTPDGEIPIANRTPADGANVVGASGETETRPSEDTLIEAIATVYDPEIPVNIYELGLIYAVEIDDDGAVRVEMTLTAPACPSAQELPEQVQQAVLAVPGVTSCHVETVWDPPWDPSCMTEEARLQLNMF